MAEGSDERTGAVLESGVRLSESSLWRFVRQFYDQHGVRAWSDRVVPSHVTSNAYMAEAYARLIMRFLQDCSTSEELALDPGEPVYIVELGAGSGYSAYLVLNKLVELQARGTFAAPPICYVATDFTRSNIEQWKSHPCFRPLIDYGLFDVARFDAEVGGALELELSGRRLEPGRLRNPMVVIANYVFDTLRQDVFRVERGQLQEGLATLRCATPQSRGRENPLDHMSIDFEYRAVDEGGYRDPVLDDILREYAGHLGDTAVPFPIGAIRSLQNLGALADGRMLVLSADKGYTAVHHLGLLSNPSIVHHGSISMMVNYHALGRFVEAGGGFMLANSERETALEIALLSTISIEHLPETRTAFYQTVERFGPLDTYVLTTTEWKAPSVDQILALLRLCAYDPVTFVGLTSGLNEAIRDPSPVQLRRLRRALHEVWKLYYPLPDGRDVPFDLGFVFYRMRQWAESYYFYEQSIQLHGEHPVTLYNMGLCQYRLGQIKQALALFERSLSVDPGYGPSRDWKLRVIAELEAEPIVPQVEPARPAAEDGGDAPAPEAAQPPSSRENR